MGKLLNNVSEVVYRPKSFSVIFVWKIQESNDIQRSNIYSAAWSLCLINGSGWIRSSVRYKRQKRIIYNYIHIYFTRYIQHIHNTLLVTSQSHIVTSVLLRKYSISWLAHRLKQKCRHFDENFHYWLHRKSFWPRKWIFLLNLHPYLNRKLFQQFHMQPVIKI